MGIINDLKQNKPIVYGFGAALGVYIIYGFFKNSGNQTLTMTAQGLGVVDPGTLQAELNYSQSIAQMNNNVALSNIAAGVQGNNNATSLSALNAQNGYLLNSQISAQDYHIASQTLEQPFLLAQTNLNNNTQLQIAQTNANAQVGVAQASANAQLGSAQAAANAQSNSSDNNLFGGIVGSILGAFF